MYMQLFGSYQHHGSSLAEEESDESASWRDGILTRVIKQMECVENMKMKIKHPDSDSTMNNVSVHSNVDDWCFFFCWVEWVGTLPREVEDGLLISPLLFPFPTPLPPISAHLATHASMRIDNGFAVFAWQRSTAAYSVHFTTYDLEFSGLLCLFLSHTYRSNCQPN